MSSMRYTNILLLVLLVGSFASVGAQNNPYKIDDALYPMYLRASKWRTNPEGLSIADTMYAEAIRKNDKKAQCLALAIPVNYYYNVDDYDNLVQAVAKLKRGARDNDYLQYYYYACMREINWLLNHGNSLRALQKAEEMKVQAFEDKHEYGIFSCINTMGNIYAMRGNSELAAEYYQNALDYTLEHLPEQDPSLLYLNLADYYRNENDTLLPKALEYGEKAIQAAKTNENRLAALADKCRTLYYMNRVDEFNTCYEECMEQVKRYGDFRGNVLKKICIFKFLLDGDYDRALLAADSVGSLMEVYQMREIIYLKLGDYEKAYISNAKIHNYRDSVNLQVQTSDLAELNAQIDNERIKMQAKALSARHHIVTLSLVISFLFLFTCFLIFYLYKRRKSMAVLQEKNGELTIARDHAEQSDKMKMYFIQNMSHEIRTPLNAIVGFSQMLSTPEMDFDDEEKQEFALRIQQSSDLLTALVEDLLDLASLESGKYTMHLESHCCNELCRSAIATVKYRKPEAVELYFTSEVEDDYQITTDEKRLVQVLINFLTNAEKYTEHGEIHLHCSLKEYPGKITFSVTDTGPGIPADKADCIFERFKKLDEFKQGSGLGLNICSTIAERLNGEVKLDKSYTLGARFLFILPLDK